MINRPTAYEQYMLELINRARLNPDGEAELLGIDLNESLEAGTISSSPKQPLAFNSLLINSARNHSQWMLENNIFSHTGINNTNAGNRMESTGYQFTGYWSWGENLAWKGSSGYTDPLRYINEQHENLFFSVTHRLNLMKSDFREIGIGIKEGVFTQNDTDYNALINTQNFAKSGTSIFLTGVAFDDSIEEDIFYSIGEGLRGILVEATRKSDGKSFSTTTTEHGGYQMALEPGNYDVSFSFWGKQIGNTNTINLNFKNIKLDLNTNLETSDIQGMIQSNGSNYEDWLVGNTDDNNNFAISIFNGGNGNDTLDGGTGDNTLIGGLGNDLIFGWSGDDVLIGVDLLKANPGYQEIDQLGGNDGRDIFVLGDGDSPFYRYGGTEAESWQDKAVIFDFNPTEDKVKLYGKPQDYQLRTDSNSIHVFYQNRDSGIQEVIATFEGVTELDINSSVFSYIDNNLLISGSSYEDILYGGDTNQELSGYIGNDVIYGGIGNDTLKGGSGNDRLFGGTESDALYEGKDNDVLIGVDTNEQFPGYNEIDRLKGNNGRDTFVLGDSNSVYYNHGGSRRESWQDRVIILDFNPHEDIIQLHGTPDLYRLASNSNGSTKIFYGDRDSGFNELIGVVRTTNLDLSSSQFSYKV